MMELGSKEWISIKSLTKSCVGVCGKAFFFFGRAKSAMTLAKSKFSVFAVSSEKSYAMNP
jgi:hypothetical protein